MEISDVTYDDYLEHYGVKGMKWGVRKSDRPEGVSKKTNREAKKDAKEFARAKMFYGEGAGTRRKLIKNTVDAKASKDPSYKKAFDHHIDSQDMSKHASKARTERRNKDVRNTAAKTARGVKNLAMGTGAAVTMTSAVVYYAAQNPTVRKHAQAGFNKAKNTVVSQVNNHKTRDSVKDWAKQNGFG